MTIDRDTLRTDADRVETIHYVPPKKTGLTIVGYLGVAVGALLIATSCAVFVNGMRVETNAETTAEGMFILMLAGWVFVFLGYFGARR